MRSTTQDGKTCYAPVLAIHGSAATGKQWASLQQRLMQRSHVMTPDIPGYGESAWPQDCGLSGLSARAQPLLALLEQGNRPVNLIAHSFGAALALELVRARPAAVKSLWLYEPIVPALLQLSGSASDLALRSDLGCLAEMLDRASGPVGMAAFVDFWHGGSCWTRLPASRQALLARQARVVLRDFREAFAQAVPCRELLNYSGPVQIAVGDRTRTHAIRMASLLSGLMPNTHVRTFRDMGHMGPCTHPEPVNDAILEWIDRVDTFRSGSVLPATPAVCENAMSLEGAHHEIS